MSGCDGWQADGGIIAQRCDGFQAHVARALHRPLIVLFKQKCPDQSNDGGLVGEDADHVAASLDLAIEAFERKVGRPLSHHELRARVSPSSRIRGFLRGPFLIYQ